MIPRVVIAGTHSGVGKTTVAAGLMAALRRRGLRVAGFKVGPDFIDPTYHALASGRVARNLDAYLSGPELVAPLFLHGARGCDVAVVEGVMGLYDGRGIRGSASTAEVARLLGAPVVLVADASGMGRSVAALVRGYAEFEPGLQFAGVVLNRVGSEAHLRTLREALGAWGIPVLGCLRRDPALAAPARHLGLVPVAEREAEARRQVARAAEAVVQGCDLDAILRAARAAPPLRARPWTPDPPQGPGPRVTVAVAAGPAFSFRYEENLELLRARGAALAFVDPTRDEGLPADAGALLVGGGFPEAHADALAENHRFRQAVRGLARSGAPVVAECGGLLALARSLDGRPMWGLVPADARMTARLTLGYREAVAVVDSPVAWRGMRLRGHEFHYSRVEPPAGSPPAWRVEGSPEGFVVGSVHASYLHLHWAATPEVADRLLAAARGCQPPVAAGRDRAGAMPVPGG